MVHIHTFVQRTSFIKRTYNSINHIHITVHPHPTALAYTESEKFIKAPTQYRHVCMYAYADLRNKNESIAKNGRNRVSQCTNRCERKSV